MQNPIVAAVIATLVAGGTAMLVSGNGPVAIGAGVGAGIGLWFVQMRKAPPA
jgi:hypothetical protein